MGKKKLSEDEIKWILSVESTEAQQNVHKLTKENNELTASNKKYKKSMQDLVSQGKKNSKEYNNLDNAVKENNKLIDKNCKVINALTDRMDVNQLTMAQLKKRAKELQNQLEHTAQGTHPEEYAELSNQLNSSRKRMDELKQSGKNISAELDNNSKSFGKLKAAIVAFISVKLVGYLKDLTLNIFNTRKEFAKYEAVLRNTFQSADKAKTAMSMLQKLTANTPYQLSELTEGYIKLVNRGMVPTEAELIKMGDIASAQGKSLDQFIEALLDAMTGENERLKEFGIKASKNGDKVKYTFKGVTTEVDNTEAAITKYVLSLGDLEGVAGGMAVQMDQLEGRTSNFSDSLDSLYNKLGKRFESFFKKVISTASDFVGNITKAVEPLSDSLEEQFEKVVSLESTLPGLISRYEELKGKASLTKDEQSELNQLLSNLSSIVPAAITEWDKYGRAISLNTDKIYEYLDAERARLRYLNKDALEEANDDMESAKKTMAAYKKLLNDKGKWVTDRKTGDQFFLSWTKEEITDFNKKILEAGDILKGAEEQIKKLSGEDVESRVKKQIQSDKDALEARKRFTNMNKSMLSAWIKDEKNASDKFHEIAQEVYNNRFPQTNTSNKDKSDPNAVFLKNMESAHDAEINEIRLSGRIKEQTEAEINLAILSSDKEYFQKRIQSLERFKQNEKKASKKADYQKQIVNSKTELFNAEIAIEKQSIAAIEKLRNDDLAKESAITSAQKIVLIKSLSDKKITKEQYDMLILSLDSSSAEMRLAIEERYLNDINDLELNHGQLKSKAVKKANDAVMVADQNAATARANAQLKLDDLVKDFKTQFKVTTVDEDYAAQLKVLEASYQARRELAKKENLDSAELDKAYYNAKNQLEVDHLLKIQQLRDQYGISNEQERLNIELGQLKAARDQGVLIEEDYEKAVQNTKMNSYKKQFDYYSKLFSSAIEALQQAEMDNVDAQYDAEIEAAKGNSEEVERLENEKAQKKLDIQKKYADVNFAIKVSQIIADTAVSIMQAFAQLGPIGGAIAAALMSVTGLAQVASANAERKKVKNMTLSGSSSSSAATGARVATGRESGGKIDVRRAQDGKFFPDADYDPDARGFIDRPTVIVGEGPVGRSKEWVASNAAVENPTIAPFLNLLDKHQQAGDIATVDMNQIIRQRMAGFSSGGSVDNSVSRANTIIPAQPPYNGLPVPLVEKLTEAIASLNENGVSSSVVLSELEAKQELRRRSRSIGSKK